MLDASKAPFHPRTLIWPACSPLPLSRFRGNRCGCSSEGFEWVSECEKIEVNFEIISFSISLSSAESVL